MTIYRKRQDLLNENGVTRLLLLWTKHDNDYNLFC